MPHVKSETRIIDNKSLSFVYQLGTTKPERLIRYFVPCLPTLCSLCQFIPAPSMTDALTPERSPRLGDKIGSSRSRSPSPDASEGAALIPNDEHRSSDLDSEDARAEAEEDAIRKERSHDHELAAAESANLIEHELEQEQADGRGSSGHANEKQKEKPPRWLELPRKDQLTILTLARLAEPLCQTSLQAYMFFQLRSFDPSLSAAEIAYQAGVMTASFTATQCLTAIWWGRMADQKWFGRKWCLLVGLAGSLVSTLGYGFSRTFLSAILFRTFGGALNGNVGVMRTVRLPCMKC